MLVINDRVSVLSQFEDSFSHKGAKLAKNGMKLFPLCVVAAVRDLFSKSSHYPFPTLLSKDSMSL